jgi:hypothetical protein
MVAERPPDPYRRDCPECGAVLGAPVSGELFCYLPCPSCGARFVLDDPVLQSEPGSPAAVDNAD